MFAQLTGDFAALTRFGERVSEMASPRTMRALNQAMAKEAIVQARDGFREERDPYGAKWAPKVFPDGNKILRKSEKLYGGFISVADENGYTISNTQPSAKFTFGTGLYGKNHRRIQAKGRALRIPGAVGRGAGGRFKSGAMYFSSVDGSPARLIVPVKNRPSTIWQRALKKRATAFLSQYFTRKR
jgi:hypothetical protein